MNCSHIQHLLSAYVDGELFGREAADVAAHVEACPSCQQDIRSLTIVKDMLGQLPPMLAPAGFAAGVLARLPGAEVPAAAEPAVVLRKETPRRAAGWKRFDWKFGVAAAAVAAFAFVWSMQLLPSAPPLVADGGPSTPPDQVVVDPPPPPPPPQPGKAVEPGKPTDVTPAQPDDSGAEPTVPSDPGTDDVPDTQPPAPADELPPSEPGDVETPDFGGRIGLAGAQFPEGDRLIAKTMHISMAAADTDAFTAELHRLTVEYGVIVSDGEDGAIRLLVPNNDKVMWFIDEVRELGVNDTFKWVKNSETDVTEAVRNLAAERDYLQRAFADGDSSVEADLRAKESRLAEYFHEVDHLALEIVVTRPGR